MGRQNPSTASISISPDAFPRIGISGSRSVQHSTLTTNNSTTRLPVPGPQHSNSTTNNSATRFTAHSSRLTDHGSLGEFWLCALCALCGSSIYSNHCIASDLSEPGTPNPGQGLTRDLLPNISVKNFSVKQTSILRQNKHALSAGTYDGYSPGLG